jgi:hypothetical protein
MEKEVVNCMSISIIEDFDERIRELKEHKEVIDAIPIESLDKRYLQLHIENQIHEYERRRSELSSGKFAYKCSFCNGFVKDSIIPAMVKTLVICDACTKTINGVMNANDAEEQWDLPKGTIKQDARPGGPLEEFKKVQLVFKSGRYWQIHRTVMESYYETRSKKHNQNNERQTRGESK